MKKLVLLLLVFAALAAAQRTTVTDTIHTGTGALAQGVITITPNQQFTTSGGIPVYPIGIQAFVVNGVFSVQLYPNDATSDPISGTSYSARYSLTNEVAPIIVETWVVPTSGSPVNLEAVRVNPTPLPAAVISLNQLSNGGGVMGDCLILGVSFWAPQPCPSGGGGNISTFALTGQNTPTLTLTSSGNYYCNGVTVTVNGSVTTISRSSGSPSGTLLIGVSCTDGHLKLITPVITVACSWSGFLGCDDIAAAAFTPDVVPIASVVMAGSTANFGAITDLRAVIGVDPLTPNPGISITNVGQNLFVGVNFLVVPQKFFGTAAPGSVAGNLPGDFYYRNDGATNFTVYGCDAPAGTAAPACTVVANNGWVLLVGGSGPSGITTPFTTSGTGTTTLSVVANSPGNYGCNGVTTGVPTGSATFTRSSGSPSGTLLVGIDCSNGHLKLITPTITITQVTCVGFTACDSVVAAAFLPGQIPIASVILAGSTANFGAITDLQALVQSNPATAGDCQSITQSGATVTYAVASGCTVRSFGAAFGDNQSGATALTTDVSYFTVPFSCTISAWNIAVNAGTATFDIWKIASGTAIPTISNTITASALPAIASGTALHSTTLTGWTKTVAPNDIIAIQLQTVATATFASLVVECDQ